MANISITQLPTAQTLTGSESVPVVQNGVTVQTTTGAIANSPVLNQTFLTVGAQPGLANSRYVTVGAGLGTVDGGAAGPFSVNLVNAPLSLVTSGTGFQVKTTANTIASREIAVGSGLAVTNPDGIAGNPFIAYSGLMSNIAALSGTGLVAVDGTTASPVTIVGTTDQIGVANGNGVGSPTISFANNPVLPGTGAVTVPVGDLSQRPVGAIGQIRYDTSLASFEGYTSSGWGAIVAGTAVTLLDTGTGLTGGPITSTGTIALADTTVVAGTYGSATQTGRFDVNAQGQLTSASNVTITPSGIGAVASVAGTANQITAVGTTNVILSLPNALTFTGKTVTDGTFNMAAATVGADTVTTNNAGQTLINKSISGTTNTLTAIPNSALTYSSVTFNGTAVALGSSGTITATATNPLTIGDGLLGTSYNGSTPITVSVDGTVVRLTGIQTLSDKLISGATNTLTAIPNSSLNNSSVTLNGTSVALGASATITATATNALTIGTGLTGGTYNGSSPVTIAINGIVVTLADTQTLTNKTLTAPIISTISNVGTLTLPTSTDTLVGRATTDTLTNKTLTTPTINTPVLSGGSINNAIIGAAVPAAATFTSATLTSGTIATAPTNGLDIVNKDYADSIASGLNYHQPVSYASTTALPTYIYNNGISGVGATITAIANGALSIGGGSPTVTQRVLVKDETSGNAPYNGVYTVTATGGLAAVFQLTRATDYDTSGTGTNEIDQGDYVLTISGTNASTAWVQQTALPIIVGTTPLVFLQFNQPITYSAGTGLNLSPATTFNLSNTAVTAATYGSASNVPVLIVNAQGQLTSVVNTPIAIANTAVSGLGTMSTQAASAVAITGGTVNGTTIGATTAATGAFTTLSATSTVSGAGFSAYLASPPAIGGTAAAAGSFTTLNASSTATLNTFASSGVTITGGTINGTTIGATTATTGKFTTVTATSGISGGTF